MPWKKLLCEHFFMKVMGMGDGDRRIQEILDGRAKKSKSSSTPSSTPRTIDTDLSPILRKTNFGQCKERKI